jgi:hypothetical protein
MISKTLAAGLVALATLTAVPAQAGGHGSGFGYGYSAPGWNGGGGHGWQNARLSGPEIRSIMRHHGYRQIEFVDRRGPTYELTARKQGRSYYIVVSAWTGEILARHRI